MREFQLQTPQIDQTSANRPSKSAPDVNKYQRKVTKKSLIHVLTAIPEEDFALLECSEEISEVSDDNPFTASPENFNSVDISEVEMVIKKLRESRTHAMKSNGVGHSKKLLNARMNVIIEEYSGGLYEEKECIDKLLSPKGNWVFLGFMLGILVVFFFWYSDLGAEGFDIGLTPT